MFFNCEWPRVEGDAKDRNIRHIASPCFAHGETEKYNDDLPISISMRKIFGDYLTQTPSIPMVGDLRKRI
jgi:hypothetical protein